MKKNLYFALSAIFAVMSIVCGGGVMAVAGSATLPSEPSQTGTNANGGAESAGVTSHDYNHENLSGVVSQTSNAKLNAANNGVEDFDSRGLSKNIMELQPMKTPFDQLTRNATSGEKPEGMKIEYASIGSRPIKTMGYTTTMATSALTTKLFVDDPAIFSVDDIILVPSVAGITRYDGVTYASLGYTLALGNCPCLQLKVCGYDDSDSCPIVYAINGTANSNGQNIIVPVIGGSDAKVEMIRVAKAVSEAASQTGRVAELPKTDVQYNQIFMTQTEESLIHKLTKRDVNGLDLTWNQRRTLEDFRMVQEGTFLFSDMSCITNHPKENLAKVWTTKGAWYQAGATKTFGTLDTSGNLVVTEDSLVDLSYELFTGEGTGGKKKLLFAGSEFIQALEKIDSKKFRLKGDVQAWDLTFTSWKTNFGEILVIHDETLDLYKKSKWAFSLDPEYFEKRTLLSLDQNSIDLNAMGVRATEAVVMKEISSVILYAPKAHARIKLANA